MMHVAAAWNLADALADGERDVAALVQSCGADPEALFWLLRHLASPGLLHETRPRHFSLTPLAELLRSDHPQSLRPFARLLGDEHHRSWNDLQHSVHSGEKAFRHRHGRPLRAGDSALLQADPFTEVRHRVDVGGGGGELLQTVLHAHRHLRGTLHHQPPVVEPVVISSRPCRRRRMGPVCGS